MRGSLLCLGLALSLVSGAAQKVPPAKPKIAFLMYAGCPNSPKMKSNLLSAMKALHLSKVDVIDILKLPIGDKRKGYGAPTILVNGKDLFGMPAPTVAASSCRIYPNGIPSSSDIEKKIRESQRTNR